jgi:hypothetical protein
MKKKVINFFLLSILPNMKSAVEKNIAVFEGLRKQLQIRALLMAFLAFF